MKLPKIATIVSICLLSTIAPAIIAAAGGPDLARLAQERKQREQQREEQRAKQKLQNDFQKAMDNQDAAWLEEHKKELAKAKIEEPAVIDQYILMFGGTTNPKPSTTMEAARQEQEKKFQQEKKRKHEEDVEKGIYKESALTGMKEAPTVQKAAEKLSWLYVMLTHKKDENWKILWQLSSIIDSGRLYQELTALTANKELMAVVGDELEALRGNMLLGIWQSPEKVSPETALKAFKESTPMYALINLYRTILKGSKHEADALNGAMAMLKTAIQKNDIQRIIDLYMYFLESSPLENQALPILSGYASHLNYKKDVENLKKLRVCFAKNPDLDKTIISLLANLDQSPNQIPGDKLFELYHKYQAARENLDIEALEQLRDQVIEAGIAAADEYDAYLASLL